jgi:hypothetical protein
MVILKAELDLLATLVPAVMLDFFFKLPPFSH